VNISLQIVNSLRNVKKQTKEQQDKKKNQNDEFTI